MGTHPIFESDFDCLTDRFGRFVCVKMPGVQNKYTVDTNNRFFVDDDENEDDVEDVENVDPFEQLKQLNKQAEDAKNAPKPKKTVQKKKAPVKAAESEKKVEKKDADKPRGERRERRDNRGPRPPRNNDDGAIEERPKREYRPRGGGGGDGRGPRREKFDRRSRDPRSSQKGFDKKEGAGGGNWGTAEDELTGQTEKVENENNENSEEKPAAEEAAPVTPPEPEEVTMTLEEYRAQKKNVNRNPNAKEKDEEVKETKKEFEAKRKGRAGRMAPVDFRPAPLVAPRGGGDRRRGGNRGDYKANKVKDIFLHSSNSVDNFKMSIPGIRR